MEHRAVIFDLGGVILGSPLHAIARFERELQIESGFINGVSCLSGYVVAPGGRVVAFSVLCNGVRSVADAKLLQEKIAARVAREIARPLAGR